MHEVWNLDPKMIIPVIDFCYNTFLNVSAQHLNYLEHDNFYLSIYLPIIVYYFCPYQTHFFCCALLSDGVEIPKLNSHHIFGWQCESISGNKICLIQEVDQWTSIDIYKSYQQHWLHLQLIFMPRCTYASINEYGFTLIYNWHEVSAEEHLCFSAQPSLFSHIVLNDVFNNFFSLVNETKRFLCAVVIAASCLLFSDKNSEILHAVDVMM